MDLVRPVGAEQDPIRSDDRNQVAKRTEVVRDAVVPDAAEIVGRLRGHPATFGELDRVALLEPADEIGEGAAAVRRDELQVREAIEEAVEDQPDEGERGVEHEADGPAEVVAAHVHRVGARWLAGMDEDR